MKTPLMIEIALHYYYSAEPWPNPSSAAGSVMAELIAADLLTMDDRGGISANRPAIIAYVDALLSVPFPIQQWIIPPTP